jgi:UDP-glucose 4-epimerase
MWKVLYDLEYAVLRYPNVYGPRQDPHGEAGVVAIFTGLMLNGKPVTINGDGEQTRDFTYVGDCALANLLAIENPSADGVYNVGMNRPTSVNEIFNTLKDVTRYAQSANYGPAKLGETRFIYLNSDRIQNELGWKPTVSLRDGLAKTVEYFRTKEQ